MLARKIERLDAVAGSDNVIAMRFQQIVEELHVQFVVLDDQDGLSHLPPHFPKSAVSMPAASPGPACSGMMEYGSADLLRKGKD
jgi:hypothetical protein